MTTEGGAGRVIQLRDYVRHVGERVESLRARATKDDAARALEEVFIELETAREELLVADEELGRASEALQSAYEKRDSMLRHYRDLFDESPDGYAVTDARGMIREGNHTLARMLGVHVGFFEHKPLVNFVVRGDVRAFRDRVTELTRPPPIGSAATDGDVARLGLRPRDGRPPFVAEIATRAVRAPGGAVTRIRWTFREEPAHRLAAVGPAPD
jgi:PAS domain S-box-containing protein